MVRLITRDNIVSAMSRLFDTDEKWIRIRSRLDNPTTEHSKVYINIYDGRLSKLNNYEIACIKNNKSVFNTFIIKRKVLFIIPIWRIIIK